MNLADPELELIDPTPNVHLLFLHFDKLFFWEKLFNRTVVRWSKRMYSCAGICSYEGRCGLCDIALSEPLLKLRPRKDLVETLLHEMIHAYLFITNNDKDRDGHGPHFQTHMRRINQSAGLNISIYHSFHDEVNLYQTHWWRCDGPCQKRKPYFGIVRRSANRAPGPNDFWWKNHQMTCGGTFLKIKEPEKPKKNNLKAKSNTDITKYISNNKNNIPKSNVLKDCNNTTIKSNKGTKSNGSYAVIGTKKGNVTFNPTVSKPGNTPVPFSGNGHILSGIRNRSNSVDEAVTVRNIWAKKQLPSTSSKVITKVDGGVKYGKYSNPNKHKADAVHSDSPPMKMKKIDDYFKNNASAILKDVYGGDFEITQLDNNKLKAVSAKVDLKELVDCPVCSSKVKSDEINRHLDDCLNKDIIAKLSQENIGMGINEVMTTAVAKTDINRLKDIHLNKTANKDIVNDNFIDLTSNFVLPTTDVKRQVDIPIKDIDRLLFKTPDLPLKVPNLDDARYISDLKAFDVDEVKPIVKNNNNDSNSRKSDNFYISKPKIEEPGFKTIESNRISDKYIRSKNTSETIVKVELESTSPTSLLKDYNNLQKSHTVYIKKESEEQINYESNRKTKNETMVKEELVTDYLTNVNIKKEPTDLVCPCCGEIVQKPVVEHLDICIGFFNNNTTTPVEGSSTNVGEAVVIDDDDDILDETQTLNATGTKSPCPCCLEMFEEAIMNEHLDICLN